jgi:signal transduction histidine kinase/ligand-binding sensor domain-containing protein
MRNTRQWLLGLSALLLLTSPSVAYAQRLPVKAYTTSDGLPHNSVWRIVTDSRGFLWFCTTGGLARFDGYSFVNFGTEEGLPGDRVNDLLETRAGDYWIATSVGLVRFTPTGKAKNSLTTTKNQTVVPMFARVSSTGPEDPLANTITALREGADGTIWVGTSKGLHRLVGSDLERRLQPVDIGLPDYTVELQAVTALYEDRFGTLWITAASGLYRRWPDGTVARYTARDGLPGHYFQDVRQNHDGRFWAATRDGGFFFFTADATHAAPIVGEAFPKDEGVYPWVNQLFETSDRRLWIAGHSGLVEFVPKGDAQGRRLQVFTQRNGLTDFSGQSLTEDLAGNLWVGSTWNGAMKIARHGFTTYGRGYGIASVNAIFQDRAGDVCFRGFVLGTRQGSVFEGERLDLLGEEPIVWPRLGCFDGQRFDWFEPAAVKDRRGLGPIVSSMTLQARSGEVWLGTPRGVVRFSATDHFTDLRTAQARTVYTMRDGLAASAVYGLFEDSSGNIWIATASHDTGGLARWEAATDRVVDLGGSPGLPSLRQGTAWSFGEDSSHNVWVGFANGVARYANGAFTFFASAEGWPPGPIRDIHLDRAGRLWLASNRAGLIRVDHSDATRPTFVVYGTRQGLSGNQAEAIVEDAEGFLYTGGDRGIDRLDPETGRVKHFAEADGLTSALLATGLRDQSGALWFGTSDGLARFVPPKDVAGPAPRALIIAVRVTGDPQPVSALGALTVSLGDLAPEQNQIGIDFVAPGLGAAGRYQYRFDGTSADWSAESTDRTVNFASLAPGVYRIVIRAVNLAGTTSPEPASVVFTILPPIWMRWWFLTLAALLTGATFFALYRYRVARILEVANMRTRIATDLHDDIGANLTRIALLSEVAKSTGEPRPLSSIARIARESVSSMSDIVWAINPKRETIADLIRRMRQHAEEVLTSQDIALHFDSSDVPGSLRLGMDVRRDLLLIFKEVINNAARHARCRSVTVDLRVKPSHLVMTISDDGVGFDTSAASDGHGLDSLRRRASRLKGTLEITSAPGGTRLTLTFPL